jgi:2-amino-4-hydroxy-6-hydroxymethyldihydropteridine diphosphokinase
MNTLCLSLGSNRGDRMAMLKQAAGLIGNAIGIVESGSFVYETEPWGFEDDIPFYNCVLKVGTVLTPEAVLSAITVIERSLGRDRKKEPGRIDGERDYRSRTIDIDILFYNDLILESGSLIIPHPEIVNRRFVLTPLNDVCPDYVHPGVNKTIRELLEQCEDTSGVSMLPVGL